MLEYLQKEHPKTAGKLQRRDAFDMDDVRRPTPTEVSFLFLISLFYF